MKDLPKAVALFLLFSERTFFRPGVRISLRPVQVTRLLLLMVTSAAHGSLPIHFMMFENAQPRRFALGVWWCKCDRPQAAS